LSREGIQNIGPAIELMAEAEQFFLIQTFYKLFNLSVTAFL